MLTNSLVRLPFVRGPLRTKHATYSQLSDAKNAGEQAATAQPQAKQA